MYITVIPILYLTQISKFIKNWFIYLVQQFLFPSLKTDTVPYIKCKKLWYQNEIWQIYLSSVLPLILSFHRFVVLWTITVVALVQLEEAKKLPVTPEVNEESSSLTAATGRSDTPEPDLCGPTPTGN